MDLLCLCGNGDICQMRAGRGGKLVGYCPTFLLIAFSHALYPLCCCEIRRTGLRLDPAFRRNSQAQDDFAEHVHTFFQSAL